MTEQGLSYISTNVVMYFHSFYLRSTPFNPFSFILEGSPVHLSSSQLKRSGRKKVKFPTSTSSATPLGPRRVVVLH